MAIETQELVEIRMQQAYREQASSLLRDIKQGSHDIKGPPQIGLEVEYSLVENNGSPAQQTKRDSLVSANPSYLQLELGAAQIELTTDPEPIPGYGMSRVGSMLSTRQNQLAADASLQGLWLVRSGTNPTLPVPDIQKTLKPGYEKYVEAPNYYNRQRTAPNTTIGILERVDVGDLSIVSILNSLQVNLEAENATDAIDLLNRSLMISPNLVAISGNARYLAGRDTGMSDLRIAAWSTALDTRTPEQRREDTETRVGLPDRYYHSLEDYLEQAGKFPFILDKPDIAMKMGIGMYWKDARIKFTDSSILVESRPISTQPTNDENIAMVEFYLGRLAWSKATKESLLPMTLVKINKDLVMKYGLDTKLWTIQDEVYSPQDARTVLYTDLQKAEEGLEILDVPAYMREKLDILLDRLEEGTPSDKIHSLVSSAESKGASRTEAIWQAVKNLEKRSYYQRYTG